jgi:hypothetical protein
LADGAADRHRSVADCCSARVGLEDVVREYFFVLVVLLVGPMISPRTAGWRERTLNGFGDVDAFRWRCTWALHRGPSGDRAVAVVIHLRPTAA